MPPLADVADGPGVLAYTALPILLLVGILALLVYVSRRRTPEAQLESKLPRARKVAVLVYGVLLLVLPVPIIVGSIIVSVDDGRWWGATGGIVVMLLIGGVALWMARTVRRRW